ncbi:MAG: ComEA family DNA-binding protein [Coriobacteriia bacterium]|nr:ComEA family DNA-binding protein [Coriobacteriia bacterium]
MSFLDSERVSELARRAGLAQLGPGALRGVIALVVLVICIGLWRFWPTSPGPEVAFETGSAAPEVGASADVTDAPPPVLVVHVAGCVVRPGVYDLPVGARVADAVAAAGGVLDGAATDAVNLARLLADGEQVYLPSEEEAARGGPATAASAGAQAGSAAAGSAVNINAANATELETLPGVGPATAQKIVDDREKNGPFAAPEDLMRVPGIGPKKFEALADLVTTG